jgi:hypothetical protein
MNDNMKKIKIGITVAVISVIAIGIYATMASAVNVYWDFEDGNTPSWTALYSNADMTIESEDNGNKYLRLSYNGKANRDRTYYDVKVADITSSKGILQADYDIMYSNNDTEKDGEIQFKKRTGPGSAESTFVSRVGKNMTYFRTHNESGTLTAIKDLANKTLEVEVGHWYSVKLVVDLDNGKQSIIIFDRDTQELLSYSEYTNTIDNNKTINMITFSSGTDMCLDNVRIYNSTCEKGYIYGSPYVSAATKNKYFLLGKTSDGNFTAMPSGTVTWTLETSRTGVSVESSTARVIVGSKPEPGPVVIKAEKATNDGTFTEKYIVNVSQ